jgi:thioredoxin 1
LIDMSADWCGPCKAVAPIVEKLADEYAGKVGFGTVDVDKSPRVPTQYQVRAIPTLLLFKDGEVVGQLTGAHPQARIVELIQKGL